MNAPYKSKFVAPLARAKGLGSAREGAHHWLSERVVGALLIPFCLWVVWSVLTLRNASYDDFLLWFQSPVNAVLMLVFLLASFQHAATGLQVVIEDYSSSHTKKLLLIIATKIVFGVFGLAAVFSILKLAL